MQSDTFPVRAFPSLDRFTSDAPGTLSVLIATEEILGPVRNGGIASTYYHLARGLAAQGHSVTVLYLKGRQVDNATPEHWIAHFAEFGIELVYLDIGEERIAGASAFWLSRWLAFYRWLKANDRFQIVHSSEWRGGAYFCLAAKRMGLSFADTLFVVKTSSPYLWNRHYLMQPIDDRDLLIASFAEQKCVEWADIVVGGSAHLLSFMAHIGYRLPDGRCYVQPNIVDFSEVKVDDPRPPRAIGNVVRTNEIVFFGRLEPRKGLELFCAAIDALVARGVAVGRVTFLGKEGEPLSGRGGITPLAFIAEHGARWPFAVEIETALNQPEALSLICARDGLAVMPSLIENSTMAVYETLVHRIPFIATAVGGTPELIDPADHAACLVPLDALALAERLGAALTEGQPIARPAFNNATNLATWYGFHRYVAGEGPGAIVEAPDRPTPGGVTRIVVPRDGAALSQFARAIAEDGAAGVKELLICVTFLLDPDQRAMLAGIAQGPVRIIEMVGTSAGEAFERARMQASRAILLLDADGGARIDAALAPALETAIAARPDDLIGAAFLFDPGRTGEPDTLFLPLGGDAAAQHLGGDAYGLELIAARRETFDALGPLASETVGSGLVHEYVSRALAAGRDYFVIPEPMMRFAGDHEAIARRAPTHDYLADRPFLEGASLPARKIWLYRGAGTPGAIDANAGGSVVPRGHRSGDAVWLGDVGGAGDPAIALPRPGRILLGFDRARGALRAAFLHKGRLIVSINDIVVLDEAEFGAKDQITPVTVNLLAHLEASRRLRVRIAFAVGRGEAKTASATCQRIEPGVYLLTSREPIYWDEAFDEAAVLLGGEPCARAARIASGASRGPAPANSSLAMRLRRRIRDARRG